MKIFVDTSAFLAILNREDHFHISAAKVWQELIHQEVDLLCTNYVLVETIALAQSRLGLDAVKAFQAKVVPILMIECLQSEHHLTAVNILITANRRTLSLVDCTSFDAMRRLNISQAFTFDRHFLEQGFECLPTL